MTEAPTLVVLGGGPAQRHAIDAAHALGLRTLVCDSEPGVGDVPVSSEDMDGVRAAAAAAEVFASTECAGIIESRNGSATVAPITAYSRVIRLKL